MFYTFDISCNNINQCFHNLAFAIGKAALAGGSAFGLGALCYYGLGLSKQAGFADQAM
jgi:hypothetical protein